MMTGEFNFSASSNIQVMNSKWGELKAGVQIPFFR